MDNGFGHFQPTQNSSSEIVSSFYNKRKGCYNNTKNACNKPKSPHDFPRSSIIPSIASTQNRPTKHGSNKSNPHCKRVQYRNQHINHLGSLIIGQPATRTHLLCLLGHTMLPEHDDTCFQPQDELEPICHQYTSPHYRSGQSNYGAAKSFVPRTSG